MCINVMSMSLVCQCYCYCNVIGMLMLLVCQCYVLVMCVMLLLCSANGSPWQFFISDFVFCQHGSPCASVSLHRPHRPFSNPESVQWHLVSHRLQQLLDRSHLPPRHLDNLQYPNHLPSHQHPNHLPPHQQRQHQLHPPTHQNKLHHHGRRPGQRGCRLAIAAVRQCA